MYYLALFTLAIFSNSNAQVKKRYPKTSMYSGSYSFGTNAEKGRVGSLTVYPETDSTILLYFGGNRGAPSYNMGQLYGRLKMTNGKGLYFSSPQGSEKSCQFSCEFQSNQVLIKTLDDVAKSILKRPCLKIGMRPNTKEGQTNHAAPIYGFLPILMASVMPAVNMSNRTSDWV